MVFDSLERWRAMSHRRTAVTPPTDPELAELLSQLRIVAEDIRRAPPGVVVERQRRSQQRLEHAIREREWRLQGDGRSERSARLKDLRATLAERDTDVISYYVLDHALAAITVRQGRPGSTPWPTGPMSRPCSRGCARTSTPWPLVCSQVLAPGRDRQLAAPRPRAARDDLSRCRTPCEGAPSSWSRPGRSPPSRGGCFPADAGGRPPSRSPRGGDRALTTNDVVHTRGARHPQPGQPVFSSIRLALWDHCSPTATSASPRRSSASARPRWPGPSCN